MLSDQIPQQCPERLALLLFRQDLCDVARNRIRPAGTDFLVNSRELILGQSNGDLRPGHTSIIPLANVLSHLMMGSSG